MIFERHIADKRGCKEKGNRAEQSAMNCLRARKRLVRDATEKDDKISHIDFYATDANGIEHGIQVKSKSRDDFKDHLCVEIKGTKYRGSLYASKAKVLMWEREDHFIMVTLSDLRNAGANMKFNWQEIAEQRAGHIRDLEQLVSELQYALQLATGGDVNYREWECWVHERDCPGADKDDRDQCKCDGNYIIETVTEALAKRI